MREGRKEGREEEMCGSSHLVEVFNDECRSQDVGPRPPKPRGFSHPSSDNEFIIPRNNYVSDTQRTDTDDLSEKIRSNSSILLLLYIKILPIWIETSHHPRHHTTRKDTTTTTTHSSLTCINNNNEPLPGPQRVETNRDNRERRKDEPR